MYRCQTSHGRLADLSGLNFKASRGDAFSKDEQLTRGECALSESKLVSSQRSLCLATSTETNCCQEIFLIEMMHFKGFQLWKICSICVLAWQMPARNRFSEEQFSTVNPIVVLDFISQEMEGGINEFSQSSKFLFQILRYLSATSIFC